MNAIYTFASSSRQGLFAFAGDRTGTKLPERHGPWVRTGRVQPDEPPPHRLDRASIEDAIDQQGYQMWRIKKA
jgi:hypothetical protein